MRRGSPAHSIRSTDHANRVHAKHASTRVIGPSHAGQKPIRFKRGGLHASTGTPAGEKISAAKHAEAAAGTFGPKAEKQERFYRNVLKG